MPVDRSEICKAEAIEQGVFINKILDFGFAAAQESLHQPADKRNMRQSALGEALDADVTRLNAHRGKVTRNSADVF